MHALYAVPIVSLLRLSRFPQVTPATVKPFPVLVVYGPRNVKTHTGRNPGMNQPTLKFNPTVASHVFGVAHVMPVHAATLSPDIRAQGVAILTI
jgi:hypothetical protein